MEEDRLWNFFDDAVDFVTNEMGVNDEDMHNSCRGVRESFHYDRGNRFRDVDYSKPSNLCAYFYRNSYLSSSITRSMMLNALSNCQELLHCFNLPEIKIVSVGGGSGADIVGLYSALYEKVARREIHLTIVDNTNGWESFFNNVESLLKGNNYGKASSLIQTWPVSRRFLCEDVSQLGQFSSVLGQSNLVFMKSLMSIVDFDKKSIVARRVVEPLQVGTMLVFLDAPRFDWEDYGLRRVYPLEDYRDEVYRIGNEPRRLYDNGISTSSKAKIYVYVK